jgi:hypothetical protein
MAPTTGTFPTTSNVMFSGKVNNGVITIPLALSADLTTTKDYNLIGNPYPSSIYANTFISNNPNTSGTVYFWTHKTSISAVNPGPNAQNFISNDYASYNLSGGTASNTGSAIPNGYIASGQGFLVEAVTATNVTFKNSMRNKTYTNTQFFRNAQSVADIAKDRVWLDLQNSDGMFSQQLIGYFNEATNGVDWGYDGLVNPSRNYISFYSIIGDEKFRIQGRSTFDQNDRVPLGYFSAVAGTFNISIDTKEGALNGIATNIYLEDKLLNVIHDLKQAPYAFSTDTGTFDDRFILRYTNSALSTENFQTTNNSVVVSTKATEIKINSYIENIQSITVYDMLGRSLFEAKDIDNKTYSINRMASGQQALVVKITLKNGTIVSRKIIF